MKEQPFLTGQKTGWKTAIMDVHYKIMLDIPVVLVYLKYMTIWELDLLLSFGKVC
jgi:hypothetical protein